MFERRSSEPQSLTDRVRQIRGELESVRGRMSTMSPGEIFETVSINPRAKVDQVTDDDRRALVEQITGNLRPGTYVEVGTHVSPYVQGTSRHFTAESPYVGVEVRSDEELSGIDNLRERLAESQPHAELITGADGKHLPLDDGSANEVFMGDVLLEYMESPDEKRELLAEAKRILRPGGHLLLGGSTIGHVEMGGRLVRGQLAEVGVVLDDLGFTQRTFLTVDDPEAADLTRSINYKLGYLNGTSYMVAVAPEETAEAAGGAQEHEQPQRTLRRRLLGGFARTRE